PRGERADQEDREQRIARAGADHAADRTDAAAAAPAAAAPTAAAPTAAAASAAAASAVALAGAHRRAPAPALPSWDPCGDMPGISGIPGTASRELAEPDPEVASSFALCPARSSLQNLAFERSRLSAAIRKFPDA